MKLNVHIERLVIESAERITREQLTEAIGQELRARFSVDGVPAQLGASWMRDSAAGQGSEPPGAGLGDAIYGSLQP